MKMILSPAKTFKPEQFPVFNQHSQPMFRAERQFLIEVMQTQSPTDLASTMKISEKLVDLNFGRYQNFPDQLTPQNAHQAIFSFYGDVYKGLDAGTLDDAAITVLNEKLFIFSGLYGLLKPLDLMAEYRLEMGTKMRFGENKNLYEFWKKTLTSHLKKELKGDTLINLASKEYFSALDFTQLSAPVITPVFKQYKNEKYKTIALLAKRARGQMVRYAVDNKIDDPALLKKFDTDGYRFSAENSTADQWLFLQD